MAVFHSFNGCNIPVCVCVYHIVLNQSAVNGHFFFFWVISVLAIINGATMNIGVHSSFKLGFSSFPDKWLRRGIARLYGSSVLGFKGNPSVSIMVAPLYIPSKQ